MRPALRSIPRSSGRTSLLPAESQPCRLRSCRPFSSTTHRHEQKQQTEHPFEGYLADKLDTPLFKIQPATRTLPEPPPKDNLPLTQREETLAKARVVFGSRMSGPDERQKELESKSQWIAGVRVPPRPEEPDNCCMSGCVNCVWERFREEMEEFVEASKQAREAVVRMRKEGKGTGMMTGQGPEHTMVSMDDDGGGSETNWAPTMAGKESWSAGPEREGLDGQEEEVDPLKGIPVGIREFMKTEKKLKKRHRDAGEVVERGLDKELRAQAWGAGRTT